MPQLEVRNRSSRAIARGGWTIPSDGKWHLINVPEYRLAEVRSATYLEIRQPGEEGKGSTQELAGDGQLSGGEPDISAEAEELPINIEEGESSSSELEEPDDNDAIADSDDIDLDTLTYRDLQTMAKERGVTANLGRDELIDAIIAHDEEE